MEPRIQYAQTKDGVSIAYWTLGEGEPLHPAVHGRRQQPEQAGRGGGERRGEGQLWSRDLLSSFPLHDLIRPCH